jgi:hypothetical protein
MAEKLEVNSRIAEEFAAVDGKSSEDDSVEVLMPGVFGPPQSPKGGQRSRKRVKEGRQETITSFMTSTFRRLLNLLKRNQ